MNSFSVFRNKPSSFSISLSLLIVFLLFKLIDQFLNGSAWFWEYFVFIPEYFFTLLGMALVALSVKENNKKALVLSLIFLMFTLVNLPLVFHQTNTPTPIAQSITIISHNKGYWQLPDDAFTAFLKGQNADVVLIQESTVDDDAQLRNALPGWHFARAHDVVTLSRFPIVKSEPGKIGRFIKTMLRIDGKEIEVYNTHTRLVLLGLGAGGPERIFEVRKKEYEELYRELDANTRCKIIGGDFNTKSNSRALDHVIKNYNDAARATTSYPITWNSVIPLFRVDYIFSSSALKPVQYESFIRLPSDHYVIKTTLTGVEQC